MKLFGRRIEQSILLLVTSLLCFMAPLSDVKAEESKDRMKAFVLSLIIPGLGQYYTGATGYGKVFIASELALWGGYYYNTMMKDSSRQDYFSQASLHAGVNPSGQGSRYLNAIGAYNSSFEYNNHQLQLPERPVLYIGTRAWEWDAEQSRLKFRNLRERELDYENNVKFYVAGIVLNHFLSALNASHLAKKNTTITSAVTVHALHGGLGATFTRRY